LGTCVPQELLGPSGYLLRKQNLIESIHLVTDGSCSYNLDKGSRIVLSAFPRLRKLSWSGLRSENDIETLKDAIRQVSYHLLDLGLDFVDWSEVEETLSLDEDDSDAFFVHNILELPRNSTSCMFPALQVLSLCNVSFESGTKDMAHVFDFGLLSSLKLRFCPGWESFLRRVRRLSRPARLKSLELQSRVNDEIQPEETISEFLESFRGLEQLAVFTSGPSSTLDIWRAALYHKASLKLFAHHQRVIDLEEDSPFFEKESDLPDLSLSIFEEEIIQCPGSPSRNPLGELDLEFLGLCCHPKLLVLTP
jgi:hypothetical protein